MLPMEEIVERLHRLLERRPERIVAAFLFGSAAREEATGESDADLGILFDEAPPTTLEGLHLDLEGDLERALGFSVQLVRLNGAPADLVHRVLRDGRLVLERDRSARIQFEVKVRNEFFDLQPILARYRSATSSDAGIRR